VISRKGGPVIQQESNRWVKEHGPVSHANPAYTTASQLPCRYVIHAVGPVWGSGDEDTKLSAAVKGSLDTANDLGLESIALPAISTGIFGYPKDRAAKVMFETIDTYLRGEGPSTLEQVRLTLFDRETADIFLETWKTMD
jgi:O-acetyl-ADP-ribose deacetylase (regulator of RNase III)